MADAPPTTTTVAAVIPTAGTTRLTPLSAMDVTFTGGLCNRGDGGMRVWIPSETS